MLLLIGKPFDVMKYLLHIPSLGNYPELELEFHEYQELKRSRNALLNILGAEEKYAIVLANYRNFENRCLKITNEFMTQIPSGYSDAFGTRLELNIATVNFLTSARLYFDRLTSHVRQCIGEESEVEETVDKWRSAEYDHNESFRFMEALRNYVQHRGLPIHLVRHKLARVPKEIDGYLEYSVYVAVRSKFLREDGKFKKSVLKELEEETDLLFSIRRYMESISNIHHNMREFVTNNITVARQKIEEALKKYADLNNGKTLGLSMEVRKDEEQVENLPLLLDWDDVRIELQKRNRKLGSLSRSYVTSKSSKTISDEE
jgi:hypothetical protein